jgi:tetratricopeptide (TPR) repeat protein
MIATMIFAAALAATPAVPAAEDNANAQASGAAYSELAKSRSEAAIARILASEEFDRNDPATLINLGVAYERIGQKDRALAMYRAAIASPDRYDLQLADGRWMDSRAAARLAANALERTDKLVLR